jgi:hypothetical protein
MNIELFLKLVKRNKTFCCGSEVFDAGVSDGKVRIEFYNPDISDIFFTTNEIEESRMHNNGTIYIPCGYRMRDEVSIVFYSQLTKDQLMEPKETNK